MTDVNATEAARSFSDLLDAVEHRNERFTVVRRGKAVARLIPVANSRGAQIKEVLRRNSPDANWIEDLNLTRRMIEVAERP